MREQEWEAAHTVWIWADRSPSMHFKSAMAQESKLDRTLVVAFALAEVLVQAGERVGMPGLMRPTGSRNVLDKMANAILLEAALSFLGLGVQPPLPSWGLMLSEAKEDMFFSPWMITLPGICLFMLVLSINLLGDGVRDVTAPEGRN